MAALSALPIAVNITKIDGKTINDDNSQEYPLIINRNGPWTVEGTASTPNFDLSSGVPIPAQINGIRFQIDTETEQDTNAASEGWNFDLTRVDVPAGINDELAHQFTVYALDNVGGIGSVDPPWWIQRQAQPVVVAARAKK